MCLSLFNASFDDEDCQTCTSNAEIQHEEAIKADLVDGKSLLVDLHLNYAKQLYSRHSRSAINAETFSIWNATYCLFILRVLGYDHKNEDDFSQIVENSRLYIKNRKCNQGAYSGLPYDNPHMVTNYSLLMTIGLIGTDTAYSMIDRSEMYNFLVSMKCEDGSFRTTKGMENDIRSTFVALLIAHTLNILTPELTKSCVEYVLSCEGFDGGFGPQPGVESHGGYVHCAVGAMFILGQLDKLNLNKLIRWISARQMEFSGGFQGRTNKLVDSCYSWWIGSSCRIICDYLKIPPFWNEEGITEYTLRSAQCQKGGFRDHAPSIADAFHSFFGFAGMCVCGCTKEHGTEILPELDYLFCVPKDLAQKMRDYFSARPFKPNKRI